MKHKVFNKMLFLLLLSQIAPIYNFGVNFDTEDFDIDQVDVDILEEQILPLDLERNDEKGFNFISISTKLPTKYYETLQSKASAIDKRRKNRKPLTEDTPCKVEGLLVEFLKYEKTHGIICFFKDTEVDPIISPVINNI
jgi:hypothetical protein